MRYSFFAVEINLHTNNSIILGFSDDICELWSLCESRIGFEKKFYSYRILFNTFHDGESIPYKDNALLNICKNVAMHLDLFDYRIKKGSFCKAHEGFSRIDKLLKDASFILDNY